MSAELFAFPAKENPRRNVKKYTTEFDEKIWSPYPRKLNCSKFDAFRAWQRLSPDERQQAIIAVQIFAKCSKGKDEQYLPHCATWLNGKRFETVSVVVPKRSDMSGYGDDWG